MMRTPEQRTRDEARIEQVLSGTVLPDSEAWRHTKVVGVTHANTDGFSRQEAISMMHQFDFVELVHNPNDQYDHNAVQVMATIFEFPTRASSVPQMRRVQIGHLDAKLAAELAPLLDAGEPWGAIVTRVASKITLGVSLMLFRRVIRRLPPRDGQGRFCKRQKMA